MKKWGFLFLFLSSLPLYAEYRVYQYFIQSLEKYPTHPKNFVITSTLDPVSYKSYHGSSNIKVDLIKTWMCPGYTGQGISPCQGPEDPYPSGGPNENRE